MPLPKLTPIEALQFISKEIDSAEEERERHNLAFALLNVEDLRAILSRVDMPQPADEPTPEPKEEIPRHRAAERRSFLPRRASDH